MVKLLAVLALRFPLGALAIKPASLPFEQRPAERENRDDGELDDPAHLVHGAYPPRST
jgi:hypothetical protein